MKLRDLFVNGQKKINEGLESQTQFVDEATKVTLSLVFFVYSFFVDSLISLLV